MRQILRSAAAIAALALLGTGGVEAQSLTDAYGLTRVDPFCAYFEASSAFTPEWSKCSGAWSGNDANQQDAVKDAILGEFGLEDAYFISKTDLPTGVTSGTVDLGNLYQNFVLALKVGDSFSLYYFTAATRTVDFVTNGAGTNSHDIPQNLSHWTLYGGKTTSVPEPGMMLLLGTGLLGIGLKRRREDCG